MFRDLKEYQEIEKIYADKVSKPEDLEENRNTRGQELAAKRLAEKPKTREEVGLPPKKKPSPFERKFGAERNEKRMISQGVKKPMPTTAEIRAKNPKVVPGTRVNEIGAQGGGKPSEGDFKKDFPDKKPEISKFTKQGKERNKAQMMAAKRIADGKSIADVKADNKQSMINKAKERHKAFLAAKEAKKNKNNEVTEESSDIQELLPLAPLAVAAGGLGVAVKGGKLMYDAFKDGKKKNTNKQDKKDIKSSYEYDAYDLVLEYLLSTEQAATIEEANYVMTEMDAETIQGIVEMQGQINRADIIGGTLAAKNAAAGKGKYTPGKGVTKDFKLDPGFQLPKV